MPVGREELEGPRDGRTFTINTAIARLKETGDLLKGLLPKGGRRR